MKKLIIGLGPGRCGSKSFVTLMNLQKGVEFYHEFDRLPWVVDIRRANRYFDCFAEYDKTECLGDCGNWYIKYVDHLVERFEGYVKFVYLHRPKSHVIRSYLNKVVNGNHWTVEGSRFRLPGEKWSQFDECYPKYDDPKKEAIERYYDDYEELVRQAMIKHPKQVKAIDIRDLFGDSICQSKLFDYLEIPEENRHICLTIRENKGYNLKTFIAQQDSS